VPSGTAIFVSNRPPEQPRIGNGPPDPIVTVTVRRADTGRRNLTETSSSRFAPKPQAQSKWFAISVILTEAADHHQRSKAAQAPFLSSTDNDWLSDSSHRAG
jgi:hypothetical protein